MHLPDGIVTSSPVLAGAAVIAAAGLALAHTRCWRHLEERMIARAGVLSAFVFALQMVNFPIGFGVSGHLLGGALTALLLGPWLAMLVMAVVVTSQCLFFSDGGLLSLGVNLTAMAVIGPLSAGLIASALGRVVPAPAARAAAAWGSVMLAACVMGLAITVGSGVAGPAFLGLLLGVHALIGIGEAVITVALLGALGQLRPDLLAAGEPRRWGWGESLMGLALAALVVVALSPFASTAPDGLEATLDRTTAAHAAEATNLPSPMNDYALAGISQETLAGILAGLVGLLLCLGLAYVILRPAARREPAAE